MNATIDLSHTQLETPRLLLRPWLTSDLEDFYAYASVPGVGEMAGWIHHADRTVTAAILQKFIDEKKTFALQDKASGKVIGSLGLETLGQLPPRFDELQGREIGYVLSKEFWGKGLMPEAVRCVIDYCFQTLRLDFLTCGHFVENLQSRRVIEKCGFRFLQEGEYHTYYGETKQDRLYLLERT